MKLILKLGATSDDTAPPGTLCLREAIESRRFQDLAATFPSVSGISSQAFSPRQLPYSWQTFHIQAHTIEALAFVHVPADQAGPISFHPPFRSAPLHDLGSMRQHTGLVGVFDAAGNWQHNGNAKSRYIGTGVRRPAPVGATSTSFTHCQPSVPRRAGRVAVSLGRWDRPALNPVAAESHPPPTTMHWPHFHHHTYTPAQVNASQLTQGWVQVWHQEAGVTPAAHPSSRAFAPDWPFPSWPGQRSSTMPGIQSGHA